jgi:alpha-tubulin suppressor-like RCC1 family protein
MRDVPKDVIKKIATYLGRNSFFAFSSTNRSMRQLLKDERDKIIKQGKIILDGCSTFFQTFEGEAYASGFNKYGQFGVGDKEPRCTWTRIGPQAKKIIRIVSAVGVTALFCEDGLYASGLNQFGQFGLGDKEDKINWVKIGPAGKKVSDIKIETRNIFLHCEDSWYGCGGNYFGLLGTGDTKERLDWVEIKVYGKEVLELIPGENRTVVRCEDGWYACGIHWHYKPRFNNERDIILEWLKIGPPDRNISKLILPRDNIFVCCEDGWYACGYNSNGQLGTGDKRPLSGWIRIGLEDKNALDLCTNDSGGSTYILSNKGWFGSGSPEIYCGLTGIGEYSWTRIKLDDKKILEVKSANCWSIFIHCEDGWYGRGSNWDGVLGIGETEPVEDWVKVGPTGKKILKFFTNNNNTFTLCEDGWYACGSNGWGQLACGDIKARREWIKVPVPGLIPLDKNETEPLKISP